MGSREVDVTRRTGGKKSSRFVNNIRHPIKVLRMADYFKPSQTTMSALNASMASSDLGGPVDGLNVSEAQILASSCLASDLSDEQSRQSQEMDQKLE